MHLLCFISEPGRTFRYLKRAYGYSNKRRKDEVWLIPSQNGIREAKLYQNLHFPATLHHFFSPGGTGEMADSFQN